MSDAKQGQIRMLKLSVVALLAVLAVGLCVSLGNTTLAQDSSQPIANNGDTSNQDVFIFAGQISHETYGLYLVDQKNKTIAVYKYVDGASSRLKLRAVRSYKFDVQLDAYNTSKPTPSEVQKLVSQQKRLGLDK